MLKKITASPWLNLLAGIILLITSGYEIWDSLGEATLGAHHGVFVFGLIQILKSIPEIMHGLDEIEKGEEALS